jgi:serine protease
MIRRFAIVAAATLLLPFAAAPSAIAETPQLARNGNTSRQPNQTTTDTIMVTFDRNQSNPEQAASDAVAQAARQVADATIENVAPVTDQTVAVTISKQVDTATAAAIGSQAEQHDGVEAAEASPIFTAQTTATFYSDLWNVKANSSTSYGVDAEDAWTRTTGAGVVVGVVDTGITPHPDLTGSSSSIVGGNIISGYDFVSDTTASGDGDGRDTDPTDPGDYCASSATSKSTWHGTFVAGIIAAIRNNSAGVVGVAPNVKVEPLRALGKCAGTEADVIAAIRWGAGLSVSGITATNPNPVNVLNLSLGGYSGCTTAMQDAIDAAVAKGVSVVAAAGNANSSLATFEPANCKNVIRVVATTYSGTRASYSNYGDTNFPATVSAPGGEGGSSSTTDWIVSTWNSGTTTVGRPSYALMVGTSAAAPHVAAVAALLKSENQSLTPAQIRAAIVGSATTIPGCNTTMCGARIVNAAGAVGVRKPVAFTVKGKPYTSGVYRKGRTLKAHPGKWSPAAASVRYQWLRNGKRIWHATKAKYTLTKADRGRKISVRVTVSKTGRVTTSVTSAAHKIR